VNNENFEVDPKEIKNMSYCRFSTDNFRSDIHCYASIQGAWVTHVAVNRIVGNIPKLPDPGETEKWLKQYRKQMEFLDAAVHKPIGGPLDGQTFYDDDLESLKSRLLNLRLQGYIVPDSALERIEYEMTNGLQLPEEASKKKARQSMVAATPKESVSLEAPSLSDLVTSMASTETAKNHGNVT
jgi:hypothetical protein